MRDYFDLKNTKYLREDDIDHNESNEETELYKDLTKAFGYSSLSGASREIDTHKRNYNLVRDPQLDDDQPSVEETQSETPYVLTEEQFSEENLHYDKVSLTYYAADNSLCDENEDLMDDIEGIVGAINLDMKNVAVEHPDIIYIRNDRLSIDYEITINLGGYRALVMGINPIYDDQLPGLSPREQQERRMRRKELDKNENV